ncbi:hypothetical protein FRB95_002368 [Tulasnella sp. JGI-2019a]|nr:hypothetical protein FRB95_002368 [Tulasnella sp. JGI-2019a]
MAPSGECHSASSYVETQGIVDDNGVYQFAFEQILEGSQVDVRRNLNSLMPCPAPDKPLVAHGSYFSIGKHMTTSEGQYNKPCISRRQALGSHNIIPTESAPFLCCHEAWKYEKNKQPTPYKLRSTMRNPPSVDFVVVMTSYTLDGDLSKMVVR